MRNFLPLSVLALSLFACTSEELIAPDRYPMKTLLHQKSWRVVAMEAENQAGEITDWLAQNPACIRDNTFITEAPGTGTVGALHAEEGELRCNPDDLVYQHHIASWKLNSTNDIFSVTIFDRGHRMLYGFAAPESYITENWAVEELNDKLLRVRVEKVIEEQKVVFRVVLQKV